MNNNRHYIYHEAHTSLNGETESSWVGTPNGGPLYIDEVADHCNDLLNQLNAKKAEIEKLEKVIDYITDVGVYCLKVVGGPAPYEKRSEWMEGWNEAITHVIARYEESTNPRWIPPVVLEPY